MVANDILLITPPFSQLNTPYPATVFLKGFLNQHHYNCVQCDLSIETFLELFSPSGLEMIFGSLHEYPKRLPGNVRQMLEQEEEYCNLIQPVISFLQGKDPTFAHRIVMGVLPEGPRFDAIPDLDDFFGPSCVMDKAKFLATLFVEDIGDLIQHYLDPYFGFSRYAETLSLDVVNFSTLLEALRDDSPVSLAMCRLLESHIQHYQPRTVGITVPFPGNFFAALKVAQYIRNNHPHIPIILGGGYINTELRELDDVRLFDLVDYVCLDDGERPLLQLLDYLTRQTSEQTLIRTFARNHDNVHFYNNAESVDFEHSDVGTPDYGGLPLDQYVSVLEQANPMQRLWSDGRWNKLALAHGCYWHNCSFCDVTLDYIKRYSQAPASVLYDRIESVIKQTGQTGFHFVDEAAPPKVLRDLSLELIRRKLQISWWTNIRFEKNFTADLCQLMAQAGCVAVSGGVEAASNRLLALMKKGVQLEQIIRVAANFRETGIMVHAYLMYGFPTQTAQETIDSLEVVRQMFMYDLIQSAFWHRFAMTVHSPIGQNPEAYHVAKKEVSGPRFANNGIEYDDLKGSNHDKFGFGLKKAVYNYMHGICFDYDLREWFDFKTPRTKVSEQFVADIVSG